jgi:hypothetical protein
MSADDVLEWGGFDLQNGLLKFRYETLLHHADGEDRLRLTHQREEEKQPHVGVLTSTFAECMGISQCSTPEDAISMYTEKQVNHTRNESILILGCGNSKFGEQLLIHSFVGPVLQIDISSKIIQLMTQRYEQYLRGTSVKRIELIVDDARRLTAVCPDSVGGGVVDKGLIDVLHCSMGMIPSTKDSSIKIDDEDENNPIRQIVDSVHRVLQPSRPFIFFSRSDPDYILRRTLGTGSLNMNNHVRTKWKDVQVHNMVDLGVLMYRFVKAEPTQDDAAKMKKKRRQ